MAQGLRLELRQSQQLVMTPQLQQAIRLLQMSNLELQAFIESEVETNPLISIEGSDREPDGGLEGERSADVQSREPAPAENLSLGDEVFDTGHENLYEPDRSAPPEPRETLDLAGGKGASAMGASRAGSDRSFDGALPETQLSTPVTLHEHLERQLGEMRTDPLTHRFACHLARCLDENGWLRTDLMDVAGPIGIDGATAEAALALLQQCDPTGVGARNLAECLGLQLAERNRLDPAMQALLDHLELLAKGEHRKLRQICGVEMEDYEEMLAEIRGLDPRPGAVFLAEHAETLVPDVLLRRLADGGWHLELNTDTLPRVLIDQRYATRLAASGREVDTWLAERRQQANWLIRSLDQRARTILKVSSEIVRRQEGFFEKGIAGLRPLTLRAVADATGIHESTASRVTSNKFIATERGIFELKFFFTNAVGGTEGDGDGIAAEAIRHRIRALVDAEDPKRILSDDTLVELLKSEGIDVARRTVAKYRKNLKIPSSVERRRQKAIAT